MILLETSAEAEPAENVPKYRRLAFVGRWLGFGLVADRVMPIMFGRTYLNDPARAAERRGWRDRLVRNDRVGIGRAVTGVVDREAILPELDRIELPALVVVGDEDVATVPAKAERIHQAIRGSQLVLIPRAGHSSTIEEPAAVNAALAAFLDGIALRLGRFGIEALWLKPFRASRSPARRRRACRSGRAARA